MFWLNNNFHGILLALLEHRFFKLVIQSEISREMKSSFKKKQKYIVH